MKTIEIVINGTKHTVDADQLETLLISVSDRSEYIPKSKGVKVVDKSTGIKYILTCDPETNRAFFVNISTGNHWRDPVVVKDEESIKEDEWLKILGKDPDLVEVQSFYEES